MRKRERLSASGAVVRGSGRIGSAISPVIWLVGIPTMGGIALCFFNPIAILILLLAIGKAWQVWRERDNPLLSNRYGVSFQDGA